MNKANDYETLLELANKGLKKYNMEINIVQTDCDYSIEIHNSTGNVDLFAEGYYEDELATLINDAWAHARAKGEAERQSKLPKLDRTMHLLGETIQEVTLVAWPIIWADNKYDQDSRDVLETIREWAWAFESWWLSHTEEWIDDHDYIEEVEKFAERKCKKYLKELGVDPETIEAQIFDETGHLIAKTIENAPAEKGHIEETIDIMLDIASIYEDMFAEEVCDRDVERTLTKEWGREFSKWWYCDLPDEERMNRDYIAELEAFVDKKVKELKEPKQKDYIVQITRIEKYEGTVSVKATSKEEAEKKVREAWGDGNHDEIYEDMTENINCDSQTYDAHEAQPGEKADFSI